MIKLNRQNKTLLALITLFIALSLLVRFNGNKVVSQSSLLNLQNKESAIVQVLPTPTPISTPTITPTTTIVKAEPTTFPTPVMTPIPVAPANNQAPTTLVLHDGFLVEGNTYWTRNFDSRSVLVRASDPDGYISKVELYINGSLYKTAFSRNAIGGSSVTFLEDPEDIFDITKKVSDWLQDQSGEEVNGYTYRDSKEWQTTPCGFSKGFVHIFVGNQNFYEVHSNTDASDNVICFKDSTYNLENLYYFMWKNVNSGTYTFKVVAYDNYNTPSDSNEIAVKVD